MNVDDIFTRVKRSFGDESAVQITEDDIIRWMNDAQREAVMQHEGLLQTEGFIDAVSGTQEYDLPSNLFTLSHIYYNDLSAYFHLRYMTLTEFSEYIDGWSGNQYGTGVPRVFTKTTESKIALFPTPEISLVNAVKLIYSRYPTDVVDSSSAIDLPVYYHGYVESFCMMKAYEMDEDWESADKKAAYIQSTLDFNNSRDSWFGHATYPSVMPINEDYGY